MRFFEQPAVRDSTPNSAAEIFRRLGVVLHVAGLLLGPFLLLLGLLRGETGRAVTGALLLGTGLALHFTRSRWQAPANTSAKAGADRGPVASSVPASGTAPGATPSADREERPSGGRPRILLLNASLAGADGNSERLLGRVAARLSPQADLSIVRLAGRDARTFAAIAPELRRADALIIATGTHWDGWSSPLQKFLEDATPSEVTELWLGKAAAVLVSEHSTGGKGVLSRLQGVLSSYGCWIPPLSGLVISKSAQTAARHAPTESEDFWAPADLDIVADNLLLAARQTRLPWRPWPVDRVDYGKVWIE